MQQDARQGWLGFENDHAAPIAFAARLWDGFGPALLIAVAGLVVAFVRADARRPRPRHFRRRLLRRSHDAPGALRSLPASARARARSARGPAPLAGARNAPPARHPVHVGRPRRARPDADRRAGRRPRLGRTESPARGLPRRGLVDAGLRRLSRPRTGAPAPRGAHRPEPRRLPPAQARGRLRRRHRARSRTGFWPLEPTIRARPGSTRACRSRSASTRSGRTVTLAGHGSRFTGYNVLMLRLAGAGILVALALLGLGVLQ